MQLARESAWTFNTSGNDGLSLGIPAVEWGTLVLNDPGPNGGTKHFSYKAFGAGFSPPVGKLAKLLRLHLLLQWAKPGLQKTSALLHLPQAAHWLGEAWDWTSSYVRVASEEVYSSSAVRSVRSHMPNMSWLTSRLHLPNFLPRLELSPALQARLGKAGSAVQKNATKVRGSRAPETFWNMGLFDGHLLITNAFQGKELSAADFTGICFFFEAGAAFGVGRALTAMALGYSDEPLSRLDAFDMTMTMANPGAQLAMQLEKVLETAKAVVVYYCKDEGLVDLSGTVYIGEVSAA